MTFRLVVLFQTEIGLTQVHRRLHLWVDDLSLVTSVTSVIAYIVRMTVRKRLIQFANIYRYIGYLLAGRSVLGKTVPEVMSKARAARVRQISTKRL